ncbi:MAG: cysteine synthase A [Eubacterium sp.]|nr:cysteine synthase A [Eubacterium sp.]
MLYKNAIDLIGDTPLVSLKEMTGYSIFAKAEFLNPGGSIKDRVAKNMVEQAERKGILKPGMTIVEPTSGNTGIGLAFVGVRKGYHVVIVMPENMSEERKTIIKMLGAELVLTPKELSIGGSVAKAEELVRERGNCFLPQQFENPDNPEIHYTTTAVELYEQMEGRIDIFVSGLGSGGTLQGMGRYLKEKNPGLILAAVEPKDVSALRGHKPGIHSIQGIGDGFVPAVLDRNMIDDIIEVPDEEAVAATKELARVPGLLCGISSGANVWAAERLAEKYGTDKIIATVLPDRMERYFSTGLFV